MESTNQGIPLGRNPSPFSSWGDIGAPYMATLSLLRITIGLPVWLFSTSIVQNTIIPQQSNQKPDDTEVVPSPSTSFVYPSPSSSSLGEASNTKNQVIEKNKKGKENILRDWSPCLHNPVSSTSDDHVESTPSTSENEVSGQKGKYKFPCKMCEGDHAVQRCSFLDKAKRVLDNHPASPLWLPPGYKKLL